ncbi:MAG: sigma-54-dependent Fis family transcriptional regulator [Xanthomonadaceae bacterium]|nr:sigma-54-dependent Fis family transcriptional regulator [Xanthomonadaceae bacterium]
MISQVSTKKGHIVVIDDDREMRSMLQDFLTAEGYEITTFPLAIDALKALRPGGSLEKGSPSIEVDLIISDLKMAQMDGMEFLKILQKERHEIPVILITAFGSIDTAIEAMKNGAYHYIVKPFKLAEMRVAIERSMEKRILSKDNEILRQEIRKNFAMGDTFLGRSPSMQQIFSLVKKVSHSIANILITGESGTGKEMVARAIHNSGSRASKPFIAINCTAIPESLLESELFGHAKGSFTGAIQRKKGLFEEASGGTLFLDEIGDMSPSLQAKLLRVIQERKVRPVGDNQMIDVDVRIVAATHKDIKAAIKEGLFREDLFYRLSVIPISIPPLRDRQEDIPLLAQHFLEKYSAQNGSQVRGFSPKVIDKLLKLKWEGNVRELENVIERAVVLATGSLIEESDIPNADVQSPDQFFNQSTQNFPTLAQLEEKYMKLVLDKTSGRKDKASQILGINRRTLYRKEREYGWVPSDSPEIEENPISDSQLDD